MLAALGLWMGDGAFHTHRPLLRWYGGHEKPFAPSFGDL